MTASRSFFPVAAAGWVLLCGMALGWVSVPAGPIAFVLSTSVIIVLPGALTMRLLGFPERGLLATIPVSFLLGLGLWSVPAGLLTCYHGNLTIMVRFVVAVTAAILAVSWRVRYRQPLPPPLGACAGERTAAAPRAWLVTAASALAAVACVLFLMTLIARNGAPPTNADCLTYQAYLRHFLDADAIFTKGFILGPELRLTSRELFQPWLVVLALVIRVGHLDLLDTYSVSMPLLLVPLSFMGLALFARELFQSVRAGLLACVAQALVLLSMYSNSLGRGMLARIIEDKFLLRFMLLPVAFWLALRFLRTGKRCYLLGLGVGFVGIVLVHPLGAVFLGLALGSYLAVSLAVDRARASVKRILVLFVLLTLALPLLIWERSMFAGAAGETTAATFDLSESRRGSMTPLRASRLLILNGQNRYIASPQLVSPPLLLLALVLAPFLIPVVRQRASARFLLANTAAALFVCYSPLTPLFGKVLTPWMLWRVLWLFPAALIITHFTLEAFAAGRRRDQRAGLWRSLGPLGVLLAGFLLFSGDIARTVRDLDADRELQPTAAERNILAFLREHAAPESWILTPNDRLEYQIPGLVGHSYGLSFRAMEADSTGAREERKAFLAADRLGLGGWEFLQRRRIAYLVAANGTRLATTCRVLPRLFEAVYADGAFVVFRRRAEVLEPAERAALEGADALAAGDPARAKVVFSALLAADPRSGPGQIGMAAALERDGQADAALALYRRLLELAPGDPWTLVKAGNLLAEAPGAGGGEAFRLYRAAILSAPGSAVLHDSVLSSLERVRDWPPDSADVDLLAAAFLPFYLAAAERLPSQARLQKRLAAAYRALRMETAAPAQRELVRKRSRSFPLPPINDLVQPYFNRLIKGVWGPKAVGSGSRRMR